MSDERMHLDAEIQDLLDGRLDRAEHQRVEAHLTECARCRARRDALASVRAAVRGLAPADVPEGLEREIGQRLARESERVLLPRRFRVAALLTAAAALILVVIFASRRKDLPDAAARDLERYRGGALSLEHVTSDPHRLEVFFSQRGVGFPTRVFDLSMMGYRLVGGRVHALAGRRSALFVYRGPGNQTVICEMFRGDASKLPTAASRHEHGGILFSLYRREGSTQVFWREGDVTCVLVSDLSPDETLALAFAKAMKAGSRASGSIKTLRSDPSAGQRISARPCERAGEPDRG
jgi:anti-sigma factor RsiW